MLRFTASRIVCESDTSVTSRRMAARECITSKTTATTNMPRTIITSPPPGHNFESRRRRGDGAPRDPASQTSASPSRNPKTRPVTTLCPPSQRRSILAKRQIRQRATRFESPPASLLYPPRSTIKLATWEVATEDLPSGSRCPSALSHASPGGRPVRLRFHPVGRLSPALRWSR
jgi:hypothetical protein